MPIQFTGSISGLQSAIEAKLNQLRNDAYAALGEIAVLGEEKIHDVIDKAHTRTGVRRAELGLGVAGRIETGHMDEMVGSEIDWAEGEGTDDMEARVGWQDAEEYFAEQENGEGRIPPMHALNQTIASLHGPLKDKLEAVIEEFAK